VKGVPVAEATVGVRQRRAMHRPVALLAGLAVLLLGGALALLVDRLDHHQLVAAPVSAALPAAAVVEPAAAGGSTTTAITEAEPTRATVRPRDPIVPTTTVVVPSTIPTTSTTTTVVRTEPQCLPLAIRYVLRGLGTLPLLGNLGDLLALDEDTCLPVLDLNRCISTVLASMASPGSLPDRVPLVLDACVPVNMPGGVPIAGR
jgi:hypothetical protein